MSALIISGIVLLGIPLFLVGFLKANAGMLFFAACAGLVLLESLDPAVASTAGALIPAEGESYIRIGVVMLPIAFGALMTRDTVKSSRLPGHLVLTVITALMLWLMLPKASGVSWLIESATEPMWNDVDAFKTLLIAIGFVASLVATMHPHAKHKKSSKH